MAAPSRDGTLKRTAQGQLISREISFLQTQISKAVLWVAENGVTNGYGDGTFGVNDTVNRAQMVTFMERAMKGKATTAESFTDVPEGAYYADAAAWAKENGVSDGMGNNMFGGNLDCLRAQIVTMLYRYFVK